MSLPLPEKDEPRGAWTAVLFVAIFMFAIGIIIGRYVGDLRHAKRINLVESMDKVSVDGRILEDLTVCRLGCRSDRDETCARFVDLVRGQGVR